MNLTMFPRKRLWKREGKLAEAANYDNDLHEWEYEDCYNQDWHSGYGKANWNKQTNEKVNPKAAARTTFTGIPTKEHLEAGKGEPGI